MKGYKAYNKGMTCRNFQYEEGKEYEIKDKPIRCTSTGFHFCKNPLDVLNYYDLINCEFSKVESLGEVDENGDDTKVATNKIKIGNKISLNEFIKESVEYFFRENKVDASSGYSAKLASSGYYGWTESNGQNSVIANIGIDGKAKGIIGTWITLAEYDDNYVCINVKSSKIDGEILKPYVWYMLQNNEFTIVEWGDDENEHS